LLDSQRAARIPFIEARVREVNPVGGRASANRSDSPKLSAAPDTDNRQRREPVFRPENGSIGIEVDNQAP
jgi:hypothetical protein